MHFVVSMYVETVYFVRSPVLVAHIDAEERLISSACSLIAVSSRFLELDEECFVLRRPDVRVAGRWRQEIRQRTFMAFCGGVAPMNREADVPEPFAIDIHRRQPIGYHRRPFDGATRRSDAHFRTIADPFFSRQRLRNLDEESGLQLVEHAPRLMLRPIVEMLC